MSSSDAPLNLGKEQRHTLLVLARTAIEHGLRHRRPLRIEMDDFGAELRTPRATFVTLQIADSLRGCIGTLEVRDPLVVDVVRHAHAAAFEDPRFPRLQADELAQVSIHISILTPPQPLAFDSEEDLLRQLRPGSDGLIIRDGRHYSTFLPSVWESLPNPREFLAHLKMKAGLAPGYWSDTLSVQRYLTEVVE